MDHKRKFWIGEQTWNHIFFAHWPVNKTVLQQFIPYPFRLDTFENNAWLSIVAFQATDSRLRLLPKTLAFRPFWQVNIRTYIQFGNERGVYFYSLYSDNQWAAKLGRLPGLPYAYMPMSISKSDTSIFLKSDKERKNSFVNYFNLSLERKKILTKNDLHRWLTDRYTVYFKRKNNLIKCSLSHSPWQLYEAIGHVRVNGLIDQVITDDGDEPILMATTKKTAHLHPFKIIGYV